VADEDERQRTAEELGRIRAGVRERALIEETARLPEARPVAAPEPPPPLETPTHEAPPPPPDGSAVNAAWDLRAVDAGGGPRGWLARLLAWGLRPWI